MGQTGAVRTSDSFLNGWEQWAALDIHAHPAGPRSPATRANSSETVDVAALTRRMARGDEMAYREFFDAYFSRLWRYLLVVTAGNEDATREALQGTFMRVVKHIKVFSEEATFWSWLTVLARSSLFDDARKRRRYFAFLDRFTDHAAIERASVNDARGEERLRELLEQNLKILQPEERDLLESKYFEGRSVRDIAGQLQTTEKAIESRLVRLREKLKQAIMAQLKHE
jgi:RNA polymerase sigma-70 factor (ECF subfamily)